MASKKRVSLIVVLLVVVMALVCAPLQAGAEPVDRTDEGGVAAKNPTLLDLSKAKIPSTFVTSAKLALSNYKAGRLLTPFMTKRAATPSALLKTLSYKELWNIERALVGKGKPFYTPGPVQPGAELTASEQDILNRVREEMQKILIQYTVIEVGQPVDLGDGVPRPLALIKDENDITTLKLGDLSIVLEGYFNDYNTAVDGRGKLWRLPRLVTINKRTGVKALLIEQYGDSDANYTNIVTLRNGKLYRTYTMCPIFGNRFMGDGTLYATRQATPFYQISKYTYGTNKLIKLSTRTQLPQVPIELKLSNLHEMGGNLAAIEKVKFKLTSGSTKEYADGAQFSVIKFKDGCLALLDSDGKVVMLRSTNYGNEIMGSPHISFISLFEGFTFSS